ncbi:hypothetical protein BH20ACT14_BH20ACT14_12560 [soil metagenome]
MALNVVTPPVGFSTDVPSPGARVNGRISCCDIAAERLTLRRRREPSAHPKDDTPGCTTQACGIRDAWGEFQKRGAVVLGVSPDSEKSHAKFRDKHELPFTLLADEDHSVANAYGAWVEKSMAGKTYMGVERSTFVIDVDGNLAKVMRRVKPDTHADQVLAALPE